MNGNMHGCGLLAAFSKSSAKLPSLGVIRLVKYFGLVSSSEGATLSVRL